MASCTMFSAARREDLNLGMAESKSKWFALFVNAHSEKMLKFDLNPIKRLAEISAAVRRVQNYVPFLRYSSREMLAVSVSTVNQIRIY